MAFLALCVVIPVAGRNRGEEAAMQVIERVTQKHKLPVTLSIKKNTSESKRETYFQYSVNKGILKIEGNSPISLCRGFYDYVKSQHCGIYSWTGTNIVLPDVLPETDDKKVESPFENHYLYNVCTYGYSMPYWDWERWEKEIDWMAVHGINMPLALVGYEGIMYRVWKKMGLTDDEINQYFVGPAHLPWMRMGNVSGIDGPLNEDWHRDQIALQHKILDRMRSLGMKPICPAFPGFVPPAFKRLYPKLNLLQSHWAGSFSNWMLSPDEDLFTQIGIAFIKEWEKEFGPCDYYLIDSFNEMEIPFPAKGSKERYDLLAHYGERVYECVKKANPNATWVMQGWMFGYQRDIWDYETLGALLSKVPDKKMLLLDLAVDYNKHFWHSQVNWEYYKGFYNKPWVYSVIPNMGGKTGMTGMLEFYANGHLEALASANKGNLVAHGMAPEGIENNEVIYELLSDAGWSDRRIDLQQWLKDYSLNRYGHYPDALQAYWKGLLKSVYGSFTDHPRYNWQFRPGTVRKGSINANPEFYKAVENFVSLADEFANQPLYLADLLEVSALYLGAKAELLVQAIDNMYIVGDTLQAIAYEKDFEHIMLGMDRLLAAHPNLKLERWIDFARKHGTDESQRKHYECNAKRIVTIWGPPVDDYSARVWSGLIRDYYLPRWKHYFVSRKTGKTFDFASWERNWVERSQGCSKVIVPNDVVAEVRNLMDYAAYITPEIVPDVTNGMLGCWNLHAEKVDSIVCRIPATSLSSLKAVKVESDVPGISLQSLNVEADGRIVSSLKNNQTENGEQKQCMVYPLMIDNSVKGNNGTILRMVLYNGNSMNGRVRISLLTE